MITVLILMTYLTVPQISIPIGHAESNMNPLVNGDRGKSKGAFQIQPKHHGFVPKDISGQMLKHDAILVELLEACNGNMENTIRSYNGGPIKTQTKATKKKTKRYFKTVRQLAFERAILQEI